MVQAQMTDLLNKPLQSAAMHPRNLVHRSFPMCTATSMTMAAKPGISALAGTVAPPIKSSWSYEYIGQIGENPCEIKHIKHPFCQRLSKNETTKYRCKPQTVSGFWRPPHFSVLDGCNLVSTSYTYTRSKKMQEAVLGKPLFHQQLSFTKYRLHAADCSSGT
jgi:hypothetical protein